jgi:hypothetical protein
MDHIVKNLDASKAKVMMEQIAGDRRHNGEKMFLVHKRSQEQRQDYDAGFRVGMEGKETDDYQE